jgi:alpha-tubulin suppressor-like RCC1 family protein
VVTAVVVLAVFAVAGGFAWVAFRPSLRPAPAAPAQSARSISVGIESTCATTSDGEVKCWGYNIAGQLGDGSTTNRLTPVTVQGLSGPVREVSSTFAQSCALTERGAVECWGDVTGFTSIDFYREEGRRFLAFKPVRIRGLGADPQTVAAGGDSCAITAEDAVKCWGDDWDTEPGPEDNLDPVTVPGLASGVQAISVGGPTCALTDAGAVKCWGSTMNNGLGDGTTKDHPRTPVDVVGLDRGVSAIATGAAHACALTVEGDVKCWGYNHSGQLGGGPSRHRLTPVKVEGLPSNIRAISAGEDHTCVLKETGSVMCWGGNHYGQLGDGTTTEHDDPVTVVGLGEGVTAISAGWGSTCALLDTGAVKCWGFNRSGQLGDGTTTDSSVPVDVAGFGGQPATSARPEPVDADRVGIYAALLRGSIESEGFRTGTVYVPRQLCWRAGDPGYHPHGPCPDSLTPDDEAALAARYPDTHLTFVDREELPALGRPMFQGEDEGMIVYLGVIDRIGPDRAHVPMSHYCGGLCGGGATWLVVRSGSGAWEVVRSVGGGWIS